MSLSPDFAQFEEQFEAGASQIVFRRVVSDLETPVSAYLKLASAEPNSFLLESVEGGEQLGRYSVIGLKPDIVWRARGEDAELNEHGEFHQDGPALESLRRLIARSRIALPRETPPMVAGVFGYLGYDMARRMERLPPRPPAAFEIPDALFIRPTIIAVFDNVRQELTFATPVRSGGGASARASYEEAQERLTLAIERLGDAKPPHAEARTSASLDVRSNTAAAEFREMVERAKEHIAAGDIFQAVLSQRFEAPFAVPPFELYRALRRTNPSPFLFFLSFDGFALAGSSPEILVRVRNGEITIRPIAGTRPRGATPEEDKALERELLADPKERAEHLMLLDLGRNDVGRAAAIGTVRVTESFAIERYSHVMHIVSNVTGQLRADVDALDAVVAGFPAGTVTGAPKIRAMEIIDALEREARGPYGGAVGYFSAGGDVDTCIALRTALVQNGVMRVQAGAGIVADSDPSAEQRECENKAKALFAAAEAALNGGRI